MGASLALVALVLLGAGIGLFIGRSAGGASGVGAVLYGAREGKDYPIDCSGAIIGRDELADAPCAATRLSPHATPRSQISGRRVPARPPRRNAREWSTRADARLRWTTATRYR